MLQAIAYSAMAIATEEKIERMLRAASRERSGREYLRDVEASPIDDDVFKEITEFYAPESWPRVEEGDWCGEHESRVTKTEELRDELADAREVLVEMDKIVAQLRAGSVG